MSGKGLGFLEVWAESGSLYVTPLEQEQAHVGTFDGSVHVAAGVAPRFFVRFAKR